jgi:hypothetical protein
MSLAPDFPKFWWEERKLLREGFFTFSKNKFFAEEF